MKQKKRFRTEYPGSFFLLTGADDAVYQPDFGHGNGLDMVFAGRVADLDFFIVLRDKLFD